MRNNGGNHSWHVKGRLSKYSHISYSYVHVYIMCDNRAFVSISTSFCTWQKSHNNKCTLNNLETTGGHVSDTCFQCYIVDDHWVIEGINED